MRKTLALAAAGALTLIAPASASAATRPPESAQCPAIVRTINHWLPTAGNRSDDTKAAIAVDDLIDPFTIPASLGRWVVEVGGAFELYSAGVNAHAPMHQGLWHIARLCPDQRIARR